MAYSEEAFRHFLAVERKRTDRSRRCFLLLLVTVRKQAGMSSRLTPAVASAIFAALGAGVREVDFVGWFREERVAGAVLTQGTSAPTAAVVAEIGQRISDRLSECVPADLAGRLQLRILQLRPGQEN